MMQRANIKQLFIMATGVVGIALALAALCIHKLGQASLAMAEAHRTRYASYRLADELRQSSDDSRLARTYVVTGDSKWERQY